MPPLRCRSAHATSYDEFEKTIRLNLFSCFNILKPVVKVPHRWHSNAQLLVSIGGALSTACTCTCTCMAHLHPHLNLTGSCTCSSPTPAPAPARACPHAPAAGLRLRLHLHQHLRARLHQHQPAQHTQHTQHAHRVPLLDQVAALSYSWTLSAPGR
jgi:hypothetical protein